MEYEITDKIRELVKHRTLKTLDAKEFINGLDQDYLKLVACFIGGFYNHDKDYDGVKIGAYKELSTDPLVYDCIYNTVSSCGLYDFECNVGSFCRYAKANNPKALYNFIRFVQKNAPRIASVILVDDPIPVVLSWASFQYSETLFFAMHRYGAPDVVATREGDVWNKAFAMGIYILLNKLTEMIK